jgi:hypothetical protein
MSYLDLARQALEKLPQAVREASKPPDQPRQPARKPWNPTPEEEAAICRVIEKDQGLPAGSVRLYSPQEFRQRFRINTRDFEDTHVR